MKCDRSEATEDSGERKLKVQGCGKQQRERKVETFKSERPGGLDGEVKRERSWTVTESKELRRKRPGRLWRPQRDRRPRQTSC